MMLKGGLRLRGEEMRVRERVSESESEGEGQSEDKKPSIEDEYEGVRV